ncbi:MAG: hypothetical protein J6A94_02850 [Lachnospiraceae bacterium]|nr:hypothetical protein [Lachnospiraceae bacterium]
MKQLGIKIGEPLEKICDKVLLALGTMIFVVLSYYSMRFTELFREGTEIIETHRDSVLENVLALAGVLVLFSVIRILMDRCSQNQRKKIKNIVMLVTMVYAAVISIIWVTISHVFPRADAGTISLAAELIGQGEYSTMYPHGYLGHNPHQYGLALILEILYFFFGGGNYLSFAYFNALCMPFLLFAGYKILHLMFENDVMEVFYFLMMAVCAPLYIYVIHIYGEVSSTTFCMILIWQVISYCKSEKWTSVAGMVVASVLACVVRMNSIIVVIAAAIVLVIWGLKKQKPQVLLFIFAMFVASSLTNAGIKKLYEVRTGVEVGGGIPHISYILMGLEDKETGPGWFNGTNYTEYADNGFDHEATKASSVEKTKQRLKEMWNDKGGTLNFFKRKVLTQWNAPDYNSFYTVEEFTCEVEELPGLTKSIFMGSVRSFLDDFLDGYQFVIYIGVTVLLIGGFRRKSPIENHLVLIAIIGGFLFSILWEAMSRYIVPYMAFSIPLAAAGLFTLQEKIMQLWGRIRKPDTIKKVGETIEKISDKAVCAMGAVIFIPLALFSMTQTEIYRVGTEIMETHADSLWANLLTLVGVFCLLGLIRVELGKLEEGSRKKVKRIVKYGVLSVMTVISVLWVAISHVDPRADAGIICEAAKVISGGDYSTMMPHGYMGHFPHQYGIVLILEIIYFLFGEGNYIIFAYFNAFCVPLLVYAGHQILEETFANDILEIYYFLLMLVCGPLYLYVTYIYGEVSSVAFAMVLIWQTLRFCRTGSRRSAVFMVLAGAFACVLRMNSMVVLIAVSIVLLLHGMKKCKEQVVVVILSMFLAVSGATAGIRILYEARSGVEIVDGMPSACWMLMGFEDSKYGPGWFNSTNYNVYTENDYDVAATTADCMEQIKGRFQEFAADKGVAFDFFKRKILTQWNSPDYNGFDAVESFTCEFEELPAITQNVFKGNFRSFLDTFFDRYQFGIYFGAAVFVLSALFGKNPDKKDDNKMISIEGHILLISVVGGVLLSLIWEAKSRYMFPYMIFLIPLGAAGLYMVLEWCTVLLKLGKRKKDAAEHKSEAA